MKDILKPIENETLDEYLWRIGQLKESGAIDETWEQLAELLNVYRGEADSDESWYRKRYKRMKRLIEREDKETPAETTLPACIKERCVELEKQRVRVRDERAAYNRKLREDARFEGVLDVLASAIKAIPPSPISSVNVHAVSEKGVYIMLSDLHYGISFASPYSSYNPDIAKQRVMAYAARIQQIAEETGAHKAHVSLMGDMISGNIHQTIRIENKENAIAQVIGASELIASFLYELSKTFDYVEVDSVSGNHSRIETNAENSLRGERLDTLIPWYCQARLREINHIVFLEQRYDTTFAVSDFMGKIFVSVHGDMDADMRLSAQRIAELIGQKIDYFLSAHMHVAEMRLDNTWFIRNGAVVTGGDEYTAKKRLYGPAVQVAMLVSKENGVESIYPVVLS